MARPIKETPVLVGKDARKFEQAMKISERKAISPEAYRRALDVYRHTKWQQYD